jgi:hypothetical protein
VDFFEMKAPHGVAIKGTSELLTGTAGVVWNTAEAKSYTHDGSSGTDVDWDGAETVQFGDQTVFVDEDGEEWLESHLIAADADPVADDALPFLREQTKIARTLALAVTLEQAAKGMGSSGAIDRYMTGVVTALRVINARAAGSVRLALSAPRHG